MKIIVGKEYMNVHNRKIYRVIQKSWFMVRYLDRCQYGEKDAHPSEVHYKTFKKNWVTYE